MAEHKASGDAGDDLRDAVREAPRSSVRRDPRADPDDDEPSGRVDVVTMERSGGSPPGIESVHNAALSFRREIAKLHQQATAFERAIEDQRRERSDAIERMESATSRAQELEKKLEASDKELVESRKFRDAVSASADQLRAERDEALAAAARAEAELKELREREQNGAKQGEAELQTVREQLERANADLAQSRQDTAAAKKEGEWLEKALADARVTEEKLSAATQQLAEAQTRTKEAQTAAAEARSTCERLERDLDAARLARDVGIERVAAAESAADEARKEISRLQRELEAATKRADAATTRADAATALAESAMTRAADAERAKTLVDESVKQLRSEVTSVFERWQFVIPTAPAAKSDPTVVASVVSVLAASLRSEEDATPESEEETTPLIRRKPTSFPPPVAEARPLSMRPDSAPPLADDDWVSESAPPSSVRKPPPPLPGPNANANAAASASPSTAPGARGSVPPPLPAAARASQRPSGAMVAAAPSAPPAAPQKSDPPLSEGPKSRDSVFELLSDPALAREAASELRNHPDWLRGRPPLELLMALSHLDYDTEASLFEVARNWENEPLSRALVAGLRDEADPKLREHAAWLLKHFGSPGAWPAFAELVTNDSEAIPVRRWLLEAIGRLVSIQAIGWRDVGDLVQRVIHNTDASLRDGVIGVVAALERSDDKRRLLLDVLRTDNDENVLSSAVKALKTALPIDLDPSVVERLLGHPSARVQQSVVEFVESSRRNAKN